MLNKNFLITGASGSFGKNSIQFLLEKGVNPKNIFALARDDSKLEDFKSKGVTIRKGDYNDIQSLVKAFEGIDKLLFISSSDPKNREIHHTNVVNAAKESKVPYIVYTSFVRKNDGFDIPTSIDFIKKSHITTEQLLKVSNIQYTILLNALYSDCLTEYFFGPNVLNSGIFFPAGNGSANYATRKDLSEAAINVLLNDSDQYINKSINLSSNESNTLYDASKILSEIANKQVIYSNPSKELYKSTLIGFGLPEDIIDFSIGFANAIESGEFNSNNSHLSKILNREPTTLKQYLNEYYLNKK